MTGILDSLARLRQLQEGRPWYQETGAQSPGLSAPDEGHDTITYKEEEDR